MTSSLGPKMKVVTIGDDGVGKTCLIMRYTSGNFPTSHIPTVYGQFLMSAVFDELPYRCSLWDTAQGEYDQQRTIYYPKTDVFIICYSIIRRSSFRNIKQKWIQISSLKKLLFILSWLDLTWLL